MKYKFFFLICFLLPGLMFGRIYCPRYQLPGWWGSAEYLLIWRKSRFYPALITSSPTGTDFADAGILGLDSTTILFGDQSYTKGPRSGVRLDLGFWMTPCFGFGGSVVGTMNEKIHYLANSDEFPILARPFFTPAGVPDAEVITFPDAALDNFPAVGEIDVDANNRLWGTDLYVRYRMLSSPYTRFDFMGGFMYTLVADSLEITDISTSLPAAAVFEQNKHVDHFGTENKFYGGLAGVIAEWRSLNWALQGSAKFGIGKMCKHVNISGETTQLLDDGTITAINGGLLAYPAITGRHSSDNYEIVTQIHAGVQLRLLDHLWLTSSYYLIYWPKVALAGEQVNLVLDPPFELKDTSFWMQGVSFGLYMFF